MNAAIRRMRWWDIPAVIPVENELFPHDAWSPEAFWSELSHDTRHYIVSDDGAIIAGYAGLGVTSGVGDIQTLAVATPYQGRGVGRELLDNLLTEAADRGASEVLLEVRSDNAPARQLYGKRGFTRVSVRRGYYSGGVDGIVMRLRPVPRG